MADRGRSEPDLAPLFAEKNVDCFCYGDTEANCADCRRRIGRDRLRSRRLGMLRPLMSEHVPNPVSSSSVDARMQTHDDDARILERVGRRDQSAMTEIFDRYARLAYSVALRVVKDATQAEDIMQDVFFQLWQNPSAFATGRGSLGAWLAVVVRNRAIDALRKRRPSDSVDEVVLPAATNVASEVERHTMVERVRVVLSGLPAEQRQSVELAFFDGLTHAEIAAQTGDPLGTVKTRIRTALISVRKAFEG